VGGKGGDGGKGGEMTQTCMHIQIKGKKSYYTKFSSLKKKIEGIYILVPSTYWFRSICLLQIGNPVTILRERQLQR
jgi:hypothetical protein